MKRFIILAVVSGLGLSACATGVPTASRPAARTTPQAVGSNPGASSGSTSGSGQATPSDSSSKTGSNKAKKSKPKSCEPASGGTEGSVAVLADVRVGTHEGYDRVTFEFAPPSDSRGFGLPPYRITTATPPITEDGSGEPVSVDGSHFAVVMFQGASGFDFTDDYKPVYTGPKVFRPDFTVLAEARRTGDFEAVLTWAFGLNRDSCWEVHVLQNPLRVAIDFPHD